MALGNDRHPLPRPGPLLGLYPEFEPPRTNRFEDWMARAGGLRRRWLSPAPGRFARILRDVNKLGERLREVSDLELAAETREMRQRLRLEGLSDAAAGRAFALVREQAARVLGMRPYDVQILGGWVMLRGMVAEMQTGEGKTLTATLPAATAALAGIPVHLVTVNDYLVGRDAELMGPLYRALGLSVGAVREGMEHGERRAAYACDIVYCTNKQLVFDYLRDRLVRGEMGGLRLRLDGLFGEDAVGDRLLLRGLCFAILDEADSLLIDEARTPLIISRSGAFEDETRLYRQALDFAGQLTGDLDYRIDPVRRDAELTDAGRARLATLVEDMPEAGTLWRGARRREELVRQALHAIHLLIRDRHYLVQDGKIQIVDTYTGRLMPDRSWERGLHQLVEVKENCEPTARAETLARISFQRFFRRYLQLGGMTGTAREAIGELWSVYRLELVTIPTHRPMRRRRLPGRVFARADRKWAAVLDSIRALHEQGRPVLVGTASVAASEHLGGLLTAAGIPHRMLNARQDRDEADIVAQAGQLARVTVATNMAGRGTDIKLGPGVVELGGLHVLATERHEAGRIDRQLYGRSGRQGDPGTFQSLVSLEDDLIAGNGWRWLARPLARTGWAVSVLGPAIVLLSQLDAERRHAGIRRRLLGLDEQTGRMLAFSGRME